MALIALLLVAAGCGGGDERSQRAGADDDPVVEDPGPVHVHGLGINPKDGALFIATHTGLFRAGADEQRARRVGERYQDTMGFAVVGPDRFIGSGHPDGRDRLPPFLGLIQSTDAGRTWEPISLLGKSDFHVLETSGRMVYGFGSDFESRRMQFLVSSDRGRAWDEREFPEPLISLAVHPDAAGTFIASGEGALYKSTAAGGRFTRLRGPAGLLAWTDDGTISVVRANGAVHASEDGGRSWREVGQVGGQPAAYENAGNQLLVALHDGTVKSSTDDGKTWTIRSKP